MDRAPREGIGHIEGRLKRAHDGAGRAGADRSRGAGLELASRPMSEAPALTVVIAVAVGILAQSAARSLRLPAIVLLLVAGAALGPDGVGWVHPRALGEGLFAIVDLAVAVILFEGGLNLEISRLRREQAPIRRLVTLGVLVTVVGGALAVRALFAWDWNQALLFGGLVAVTGPTVIGPLVNELRLRHRVSTVLEAEGVLIDPIGAIAAVLLLEVALATDTDSLLASATSWRSGSPSASPSASVAAMRSRPCCARESSSPKGSRTSSCSRWSGSCGRSPTTWSTTAACSR